MPIDLSSSIDSVVGGSGGGADNKEVSLTGNASAFDSLPSLLDHGFPVARGDDSVCGEGSRLPCEGVIVEDEV